MDLEGAPRCAMVSEACFRLLSFQRETQNEVEVLKPILEEREVLRLTCALGGLKDVNPKDFTHDLLEARDFDDDFAQFLRADVLDGGAHGDSVRVVGVVGRQAQVKAHLKNVGVWDPLMETRIGTDDIGLYAVVMDTGGTKTVVVFAWIIDYYFDPERLRATPTHLVRFLTCLTPNITCCLSGEDEAYFRGLMLEHDSGDEDDDDWRSYSVEFHVEQQQDAKDDVKVTRVGSLPLPGMSSPPSLVKAVHGTYPGCVAVCQARPTKKTRTVLKQFQDSTEWCDWVASTAEQRDVRFDWTVAWPLAVRDTMLHKFGMWPAMELEQLELQYRQDAACLEEYCRRELEPAWAAKVESLRNAGEDVFRVEAVLNGGSYVKASIDIIKRSIGEATKKLSPAFADDDSRKTTRLPIRFPRLMGHLLQLHEGGLEDDVADVLQKAPTMFINDLAAEKTWMVETMTGFWKRWTGPTAVDESFRARMADPCQTLKQVWWVEMMTLMERLHRDALIESQQKKAVQLRAVFEATRESVVKSAFSQLLAIWSAGQHDLSLFATALRQHADGTVHGRFQEEFREAGGNVLIVWSLKESFGSPQFERLGEIDLLKDEEVIDAFTVKSRSLLIVSTSSSHCVRRVEFPVLGSWARTSVQVLRRGFSRRISVCDFYEKERLLVVGDATGTIGIYRLSESLSSLEIVRSIDVGVKTSLVCPLQSVLLNDGVLFMVDQEGAIQSINTRNQQTSRKIALQVEGGYSCRLVRAMDGAVLGWLDFDRATSLPILRFMAADDMRELPQSTTTELHLSASMSAQSCAVVGDTALVIDSASCQALVLKLEATLEKDSFRIRTTHDSSHPGATDSQPSPDAIIVDNHWLWVFYHLYEKFPVRGELFHTLSSMGDLGVKLAFATRDDSMESTTMMEGCIRLLRAVQDKLLALNKPLASSAFNGDPKFVSDSEAVQLYARVTPQAAAALVRELVTFVPIQICRAEHNSLTLMTNGQPKDNNQSDQAVSSVDIARKLRFGLLSPLLTSWLGQCIVVTSMGKQSTGKSYFLNHLTGSSFAIAGARCTDGAWMSVRILPKGVLLIVIDFEGLGSFERTEQEDVFLSVLNASVSMLTIFRMEMRLDREIDELFSKFQKGSQLVKRDQRLFRGKLYMSVKDVNPNDQRGVVNEFVTKFQRLLETNREHNFLSDMYAGQLDINCSPPLGTIGYHRSLQHARKHVETKLCGNPTAGFASGKDFLDCIRLMLAKISILDWTSLDDSAIKLKVAELTLKLPDVLRFGCDTGGGGTTKAPLLTATAEKIEVTLEQLCATYPSMAQSWIQVASMLVLDQVDDEAMDLGQCVLGSITGIAKVEDASATIRRAFQVFLSLLHDQEGDGSMLLLTKSTQVHFDGFLSFLVRRRCARVQSWSRSVFGESIPESWQAVERQALDAAQTLLVRCHDQCSLCQLACMKASAHSSNGDQHHDCGTNHSCAGKCQYCSEGEQVGKTPSCSKPAGHDGHCECAGGDHTCRVACLHAGVSSNCGKVCAKKVGHTETEHRCSVGLHKCGLACVADGCTRLCVLDVESPHTAHKCEVDRCLVECFMDGCKRQCQSTDHFHGKTEARITFAAENPDSVAKDALMFDAESAKPVVHMCDEAHDCVQLCEHDGICHIDVFLKQSSKTYAGERGSFQYTYQEMNGSRKKCSQVLSPGQTAHSSMHSCCAVDGEHAAAASSGERVQHYCKVRCACCSYYCQKEQGHAGLHKTTHGNMRNTVFLSDDKNIDLVDRKYAAGESGIAEMCSLYCSKMGRGHVHYLDCDKAAGQQCVYKGNSDDMRRHCQRVLEPKPDKEQDEVLHERFWETLGWEDPCTSVQERELFAKCAYKCDAPDHDDKQASYCVLPAWHTAVTKPQGPSDGFSYIGGHKFECSHVAAGSKMHHLFVLDASGSMQGSPWEKLLGAFNEYVHNRISIGATNDVVSVVTFSTDATIVWEAVSITRMTQARVPFTGGGTSFGAGLRSANEVLSRNSFDVYKPVLVFFSDGQPGDAQAGEQLATHISSTYSKYGLAAFAVGFGQVNLSILERVATKLGGVYRHVISGDELKSTFHTISASLGTRAGLALSSTPHHDMICVICQKELATEATTELAPCQHVLHRRCFVSLIAAMSDSDTARCPSCRQAISNNGV